MIPTGAAANWGGLFFCGRRRRLRQAERKVSFLGELAIVVGLRQKSFFERRVDGLLGHPLKLNGFMRYSVTSSWKFLAAHPSAR